ncbi:hypothetical protein MF271_21145 (plasmid) [Deinococcus sp. KNUC1210]|uniref:hypothetical protein n=1 Tax=Deinococcus sp. KNUC1210 TaxID=2917691 RepID=UPI001EF11F1F|nr:hypothetical protein [Deinococcus sp. KNUC1210]ULH17559.1 hypothetical protein MF271_21145 [Deinococcus sp. KNUC1210]
MTTTPFRTEVPARSTRSVRRFQPARATLLLLLLSTGMLGYSATQVLTGGAGHGQRAGFHLSSTQTPLPAAQPSTGNQP